MPSKVTWAITTIAESIGDEDPALSVSIDIPPVDHSTQDASMDGQEPLGEPVGDDMGGMGDMMGMGGEEPLVIVKVDAAFLKTMIHDLSEMAADDPTVYDRAVDKMVEMCGGDGECVLTTEDAEAVKAAVMANGETAPGTMPGEDTMPPDADASPVPTGEPAGDDGMAPVGADYGMSEQDMPVESQMKPVIEIAESATATAPVKPIVDDYTIEDELNRLAHLTNKPCVFSETTKPDMVEFAFATKDNFKQHQAFAESINHLIKGKKQWLTDNGFEQLPQYTAAVLANPSNKRYLILRRGK